MLDGKWIRIEGGIAMIGSMLLAVALTGQVPVARPAPAAAKAQEHASLAAKRRSRKTARYVARLDAEAREAQAERAAAEAAHREYMRMLPYMLEVRRQDMARASAHDLAEAERSKARAIAQAAGYSSGVYQAPRIMNQPGLPYAP
jgi:hypothetical protein